ncbi:MAG: DUF1460 domain-containing protein [Bacteroidales bacterium]|nr:DUF1460 domain-containing protein [Bacteroidales bacterium]
MRRWLMLLLLSVPMLACGQARPEAPGWVTTPADSLLAERVLAELAPYAGEPVPELMARAGKALEGQQYVAGTLDELPDEHLCIYLTRTDCIIFVETCLALSRTAARGGDFRMFADEIRQSRYRGGRVESYADRLHYTTEWARQGEDRGVLKDVTLELGGTRLDHPVNYMSEHPGSYPLMNDVDAIRKVEDNINSKPRCYIPKNRLVQALQGIRTGDIICLVTSIEGLDISHVMMAIVDKPGSVRLLHASTGPMKVIIDSRTLPEYLAARSSVTGVQILRPQAL